MNPVIERAVGQFSPRHKRLFLAALAKVPSSDIGSAAGAVKTVCKENNLADFPNPFPHETQARTAWDKAWSGFQGTDFETMRSKAVVVAFVKEHFGVDLDPSDFTRDALNAEAARIEAQAA